MRTSPSLKICFFTKEEKTEKKQTKVSRVNFELCRLSFERHHVGLQIQKKHFNKKKILPFFHQCGSEYDWVVNTKKRSKKQNHGVEQ